MVRVNFNGKVEVNFKGEGGGQRARRPLWLGKRKALAWKQGSGGPGGQALLHAAAQSACPTTHLGPAGWIQRLPEQLLLLNPAVGPETPVFISGGQAEACARVTRRSDTAAQAQRLKSILASSSDSSSVYMMEVYDIPSGVALETSCWNVPAETAAISPHGSIKH